MIKQTCPECKGELVSQANEIFCKKCGLVLDDTPINHGYETSQIDGEKQDRMRRTGMPINYLNPFWGTSIDPKNPKR